MLNVNSYNAVSTNFAAKKVNILYFKFYILNL